MKMHFFFFFFFLLLSIFSPEGVVKGTELFLEIGQKNKIYKVILNMDFAWAREIIQNVNI